MKNTNVRNLNVSIQADKWERFFFGVKERPKEGDLQEYGVATISRLLKIIRLFCKKALSKRRYSAKETCYCKEPTNRSHPTRTCIVSTGCAGGFCSHQFHTEIFFFG